jgi:hypothetical protein
MDARRADAGPIAQNIRNPVGDLPGTPCGGLDLHDEVRSGRAHIAKLKNLQSEPSRYPDNAIVQYPERHSRQLRKAPRLQLHLVDGA